MQWANVSNLSIFDNDDDTLGLNISIIHNFNYARYQNPAAETEVNNFTTAALAYGIRSNHTVEYCYWLYDERRKT